MLTLKGSKKNKQNSLASSSGKPVDISFSSFDDYSLNSKGLNSKTNVPNDQFDTSNILDESSISKGGRYSKLGQALMDQTNLGERSLSSRSKKYSIGSHNLTRYESPAENQFDVDIGDKCDSSVVEQYENPLFSPTGTSKQKTLSRHISGR